MAAALGIDVSKEWLDAVLLDDRGKAHKKVANNAKGFSELTRWLKNRKAVDVHVCMEATGTYFENIAEYLADGGRTVSVVNPAQIKAYSQSLLLRAKTDKVDAETIALFCRARQPAAWNPPSPKIRTLRGLVRFRANLVENRASYEVQEQTPNLEPKVRRSIIDIVAALDTQITVVEREIAELIRDDDDLRGRCDLLCSIQGIGEITAATILVETPNLAEFRDAKAVSAFAGLSPRTHSSGSSVRGRGGICKIGNARLRTAMWWPAIAALRHNAPIRELAARMEAAGKPKMKIIVAAMRKLLVFAYGVLKSKRPFQGGLTTAS